VDHVRCMVRDPIRIKHEKCVVCVSGFPYRVYID
jgi:hypothetical protein